MEIGALVPRQQTVRPTGLPLRKSYFANRWIPPPPPLFSCATGFSMFRIGRPGSATVSASRGTAKRPAQARFGLQRSLGSIRNPRTKSITFDTDISQGFKTPRSSDSRYQLKLTISFPPSSSASIHVRRRSKDRRTVALQRRPQKRPPCSRRGIVRTRLRMLRGRRACR